VIQRRKIEDRRPNLLALHVERLCSAQPRTIRDAIRARGKSGTQGAVASPLLANVYLHYAFDLWVQHWRQHRATGEVIVVRYADDAVLGFQHRADAEQFLRDWKERLGRFGLELHPDKTRLIEFGCYAVANRKERGEGKPETFNFLGFTHICGQTWKTGKFLVLRKTIHKRLAAKLRALKEELRRRKHLSVAELGKCLRSVVQGYFNYHAVPGNLASLRSFRLQVIRRWMRALRRRSQKSRMTWPRLVAIAERWLPNLASFILIPICALKPTIRGTSRLQQSCTCGSVRGASGQLASLPRPLKPEVCSKLPIDCNGLVNRRLELWSGARDRRAPFGSLPNRRSVFSSD
jgi:RNA-directed DNA polymerase